MHDFFEQLLEIPEVRPDWFVKAAAVDAMIAPERYSDHPLGQYRQPAVESPG